MKNPHKDLPRVIIFGIPVVIVCYMLANVAYLAALKPEVVIHTNTVSMDFGKKIFGPAGGILFAVCVALSCFGVKMFMYVRACICTKVKTSLRMQVFLQGHALSMCQPNKVIFQDSLEN